jgi:zinc D-Ala-D-Ala carboxypeptidase
MARRTKNSKKVLALLLVALLTIVVVGFAVYFLFIYDHSTKTAGVVVNSAVTPTPTPSVTPSPTPTATPTVSETVSRWPVIINNSDAGSITVIVNKKHRLTDSFVPPNLTIVSGQQMRDVASISLTNLFTNATKAGFDLKAVSGYRSYANQQSTYNGWVNQYGQTYADTISARAGYSEHQTGLVADVGLSSGECQLETCFGDTLAGKWVAQNAQYYGFVIRYPLGKDSITGYQYEPWHLRYLGIDEAVKVYNSGKTLEEYYGVEGGGY